MIKNCTISILTIFHSLILILCKILFRPVIKLRKVDILFRLNLVEIEKGFKVHFGHF